LSVVTRSQKQKSIKETKTNKLLRHSVLVMMNCRLAEPGGQTCASYSSGGSRRGLVEPVHRCSQELPGSHGRAKEGVWGPQSQGRAECSGDRHADEETTANTGSCNVYYCW